jgi:type VI secretion system protein ImpJ
MSDGQPIAEAVQWHEGMLLSPQHFQQATLRSDQLVAYHLLAASPFHWGIRRLAIDMRVLVDGIFRIDAVEAILPDGLVVVEPLSGNVPLQIDLTSVDHDFAARPGTLHLCVATRSATVGGSAGVPRFRSVESAPVCDENTGDGEIAIPRLRPVAHLFVTDGPTRPPPNLYVSIPIARVAFRADGYGLEPYVPPMFAAGRDSPLFELVEQAARHLREKAMALSERLQGPLAAGDQAISGEGWTLVRALVQSLLKLEGLLSCGAAHPFALYLALCEAAGSVACLDAQPCPAQFPPYLHNDALPAFRNIAQFVEHSIARLHDPYQAVRFAFDQGRFQLTLRAEWLEAGALIVGVRAGAGQAMADVAEWLTNAWIGSTSRMRTIRNRRILGAARRPIERVESLGLVPPRGVMLFAVEADPQFVVGGEQLEIARSSGPEALGLPAETVLYVPPEQPATADGGDG